MASTACKTRQTLRGAASVLVEVHVCSRVITSEREERWDSRADREFKIANGALLVHPYKLSCAPAPLAEESGKCRQGYSDALNALHVCDLKRPKDTSASIILSSSPPPSPTSLDLFGHNR